VRLAEAVQELDAFAYAVSHDLHAPLRAIDGFSRILLEDFNAELPAAAQRYLGLVRSNAEQLAAMIEALIAFSRTGRQPLERRSVDLANLARQVYAALEAERVDRAVRFVVEDLPAAVGDPTLLRQTLANLIANALKFTRRLADAEIIVGWRSDAGVPVYWVRDNGAGFDMRYADKLFGVFQRLHRTEDYEGLGIGLATVQRIVRRHSGRVWAEAAENEGATFYFTLGNGEDR
jgi:light-regulated signal transduction histidine kinase (bacteriophytochrome)